MKDSRKIPVNLSQRYCTTTDKIQNTRRINRLLGGFMIVCWVSLTGCQDEGHDNRPPEINTDDAEPTQIHVDVGMPGGVDFATMSRSAAAETSEYSNCHEAYMVNRVTGLESDAFAVYYISPESTQQVNITSIEETEAGRYIITIEGSHSGGTPLIRIDTGSTLLSSAGYGSATSPIKSNIFTAAFTELIEEDDLSTDAFVNLTNEMCALAPLIPLNLDDIEATLNSLRDYHRTTETYTVGGTAVGITTPVTLSLANNSISDQYLPEETRITLNVAGDFSFTQPVKTGGRYDVRVIQGGTCEIQNGSGIVASDVSNIIVDCTQSETPPETADYSQQINAVLFELNNSESQTQKARAVRPVFLEAIEESPVSDFVVRIPGAVARDLIDIGETLYNFSTTVDGVLYQAASVTRDTGSLNSVPFDKISFEKLSRDGSNYSADIFVDIFSDNSTVSDGAFQSKTISIYDNGNLWMTGSANKYLTNEGYSLELTSPIDGWARFSSSDTYDLISRVAENPGQYTVVDVYLFPDDSVRYIMFDGRAIRYDNQSGCTGDVCGSVLVEENDLRFKVADIRLQSGIYSASLVDIDRDGDALPDSEDPDVDGDSIINEDDEEPLTPNFGI